MLGHKTQREMIGLVLGLYRLLDLKFFVFLRITEIYKEKLSKKEIALGD
jgi:hypothetical protein